MMRARDIPRAIWTIYLKEARETFRDRRAMVTITLVSVLLPIAMMVSFVNQAETLVQEAAPQPIMIEGGGRCPYPDWCS